MQQYASLLDILRVENSDYQGICVICRKGWVLIWINCIYHCPYPNSLPVMNTLVYQYLLSLIVIIFDFIH